MESFRLSPQQWLAWSQQTESAPALRADGLIQLQGPLDAGRLAAAVARLVERYEILRTTFPCPPGLKIPLQMIAPAAEARLSHIDLTGLAGPRGKQLAEELFEGYRRWPFDLGRGPLARFCLVEVSAAEHFLLVSLPAVCADETTLELLAEEIGLVYAGDKPAGEVLQYADVAEWANELVESEEAQEAAPFWQRRLLAPPPSLPFGADSSGEGMDHPWPAEVSCRLGAVETARLREVGRELEGSVETVLLAAWMALWRRLGGSLHVVVGVAADGRRLEDLAQAVGPLTRFLPVEAYVDKGEPFAKLMSLLAGELAEGRRWQEYFDWRRLDLGGGSSHPLLGFDVREAKPAAGGFRLVRACCSCERFAVQLYGRDDGASLDLVVRYDRFRLDPEEAGRLLGRFTALLEDALRSPDRAVGELAILSAAERRQLLLEREASQRPVGRELAHERIAAQARHTPARTAVVFEDLRLTYAELAQRSDRLACHLQTLGVGPEVLVGVYMERSPALVTGLLGILKAGGAFLPLDPEYPQERLAFLLRDSQASVLLCQPHLRDRLPQHTAVEVLWDEDTSAAMADGAGALAARPCDGNLAYVIYTSGSTGAPKGALITQGALRNYLAWVQDVYPLTEEDRVLQKTPLGFDVAVRELFWPLAAGATLVLARPGGQRDSSYLARLCARQSVSVLNFVPSQLAVFLEDSALPACSALRRVLSGGEELSGALAERFFARLGASLHNHYGPTETTITATYWTCRPETGERRIPIGRPLANTSVLLLDELLQPVPFGLPGEVMIGGAGLARGYLARPALTAERFIPDPFAVEPGARLYRTGDLARRGPHGGLEFLGRLDHQVKVRGFRIELGEIEHVLRRHAAVREAVVTVGEDPSGNKRLLAYVVPAGPAFTDDELRAHAGASLPEHMVPARIVRLGSLPSTPSGKIDRRALPDPEEAVTPAAAPRSPTEEYLVALWRELLKVEEPGVEGDFFQLGGHSLLATQAVSRVRETLHTELSLRSLFEAPTPALLARRIDAALQEGQGLEMPPILPVPRDAELPLSFAQKRLWFLDHLQSGSSAYNVPLAVGLRGPLDPGVLGRALSEVVRRHEPLRALFLTRHGEPVQVIEKARPVSVPVVDLGAVPESLRHEETRRLVAAETARPIDIRRGPLLRLCLLREDTAGREHVALLTFHHIATDGWSTGVFVREMAALYGAFAAGHPSPLPELPIQYADFAAWQARCFEAGLLDGQLAYWKRALAGAPATLRLPLDRPRTGVQSFRGAELQLRLPRPLSAALDAFGRAEKVTPFMTLLAAFNALLHHAAGEDDIVVGTDVANRNRRELEGLIGFFVNNLALRVDLAGNPSFRELVHQVRRTVITAFVNQDVPFDKLVERLQPERRLGQMPLFQVLFVLQNQPAASFDAPGLELEILPLTPSTSKFDLSLFLRMGDEGLAANWVYNPDLFETATIARIAESFEAVLATALAEPDTRLSQLDLPQRTAGEEKAQRRAQRELDAFKKYSALKPQVVDLEG